MSEVSLSLQGKQLIAFIVNDKIEAFRESSSFRKLLFATKSLRTSFQIVKVHLCGFRFISLRTFRKLLLVKFLCNIKEYLKWLLKYSFLFPIQTCVRSYFSSTSAKTIKLRQNEYRSRYENLAAFY